MVIVITRLMKEKLKMERISTEKIFYSLKILFRC